MKKQVLFLAAFMTAAVLAGCGQAEEPAQDNQNNVSGNVTENAVPNHGNSQQNSADGSENADAGTDGNTGADSDSQLGVGIVSRMKRVQNAGGGDGSAEINTTIAAVTVDAEGRISSCFIDKVENKLSVSNTGAIGSAANTEYPTTKELGDSYGMKDASPIGKEWYEQIQSFEEYVIGKTVEEINGIHTDDQGYIQESDLNSSVTISITDFQAAITKAVENARSNKK